MYLQMVVVVIVLQYLYHLLKGKVTMSDNFFEKNRIIDPRSETREAAKAINKIASSFLFGVPNFQSILKTRETVDVNLCSCASFLISFCS